MKLHWLAAALAVSGCGGSNDNPTGSADQTTTDVQVAAAEVPKACDVLTQADAAKALDHEVKQLPNDGGPANLNICQYGYEGERIMDSGNASVVVEPVDIGTLRTSVTGQGYTTEPVAELGDGAFWSKEVGLYVGKGNRTAHYLIAVGGENEAQGKTRAIELAKATVGRL